MTPAQSKWHEAHKEEKKDYDRAYREKNREKKRANARAWYLRNRETLIAKAVANNRKNPEQRLKSLRKYATVHREKIAAKTRAWYQANKALALERARDAGLKKRYGISQKRYLELLTNQGGKCAICGTSVMTKKHPPVDHCHKTGKVREILCYRCNTGLGQFLDSPELLLKAHQYLVKHGQITA